MKNSILASLVALAVILSTNYLSGQAPLFQWALTTGSTGSDDGRAIDSDANGNLYVTGTFSGTVDLDPGNGTHTVTAIGGDDVFIQKFDPNGELIWAGHIGGWGEDVVRDIHVDQNGDLLLAGRFEGNADFDPGIGIHSVNTNATKDAFILHLESSGSLIWVNHIGDLGWSDGRAVGTDDAGNIYFTGSFQASPDFDPGPGVSVITSLGYSEVFIQKLNANGDHIWARANGGAQTDNGRWLTADANGNLVLSGRFESTTDFDPGPGVHMLAANGGADGYIQKLDNNGDLLWVGSFGGTDEEMAFHHAVDDLGNIYITGWFYGVSDLDPTVNVDNYTSNGDRDVFVIKLDANGALNWIRTVGGNGEDLARSISIDAQRNVYVTGRFQNTVDFDPGSGTDNLTSNGDSDAFYLILDENGDHFWAAQVGGVGFDDGFDIHVNDVGDIYATGAHSLDVDLDPGIGVNPVTSSGQDDIHLIKLRGILTSINENDLLAHVSYFPNPVRDQLTILLNDLVTDLEVRIIDNVGRTVSSHEYTAPVRIDLPFDHASGHYLIELTSPEGSMVFQLIKE